MNDERGQAVIFVALALVMLIGFVGFAVDVGNTMTIRRALQASTDAAATAGAQELSNTSGSPSASAIAKASEFSSVTGNKNARANIPGVSISTSVKCTNFMAQLMTSANCTNATTPANTLVVTQTSVVPMFFAKVLGFPSLTVRTTATAAMKGGAMPPLDIIVVLDTTGSMSGTPLVEAKEGIRTLLSVLWPCAQGIATCGVSDPPIDKVGLMIFPGLASSTDVGREYDCTGSPNPVTVNYNASPIYEIIPMTNDYRTSTVSVINPDSNFVKAVDGRSGCSGAESIGGFGSYFAAPLAAAQSSLVSAGRATVQNVIIFVSDGDANEYPSGPTDPCNQAILAAQAAKAAGTWVYSIGYGVPGGGCGDDPPGHPTALQTMQRINSDYPNITKKFFNVPSAADLRDTFRKIGTDLLATRMLDDSTN